MFTRKVEVKRQNEEIQRKKDNHRKNSKNSNALNNVLNFNKNNYTRMSQSRSFQTDFCKTLDSKTSNKINSYFRLKQDSLRNIKQLTNNVKALNSKSFKEN